jgi:hypothetical protein
LEWRSFPAQTNSGIPELLLDPQFECRSNLGTLAHFPNLETSPNRFWLVTKQSPFWFGDPRVGSGISYSPNWFGDPRIGLGIHFTRIPKPIRVSLNNPHFGLGIPVLVWGFHIPHFGLGIPELVWGFISLASLNRFGDPRFGLGIS